jgi:hypothetical protein
MLTFVKTDQISPCIVVACNHVGMHLLILLSKASSLLHVISELRTSLLNKIERTSYILRLNRLNG